jgi:protein-S-isoprenylcysteine O-methyltransferase Ste14
MNMIVFLIGVLVNAFLLSMMFASARHAQFQYWPPPGRHSWQYHSLWWSVRLLVVCICVLIYIEHSSLALPSWLRFYFAMPLFFLSFALGTVAAKQLGWANTHGIAEKFVARGFYKYSRNPQYVFYSVSFISLGIWAASAKALVLLTLLSFWYLRAPFPEERWLESKYGERYTTYKNRVPRYFGWHRSK